MNIHFFAICCSGITSTFMSQTVWASTLIYKTNIDGIDWMKMTPSAFSVNIQWTCRCIAYICADRNSGNDKFARIVVTFIEPVNKIWDKKKLDMASFMSKSRGPMVAPHLMKIEPTLAASLALLSLDCWMIIVALSWLHILARSSFMKIYPIFELSTMPILHTYVGRVLVNDIGFYWSLYLTMETTYHSS